MPRIVPTPLLALAAVAALGVDTVVLDTLAHAEGDTLEKAVPARIPPEAFLTGETVQTATVDGVDVRVVQGQDGSYALELSNPSVVPRAVSIQVATWRTTGSRVARMMAMPEHVGDQTIATVVAPGGPHRVALGSPAEAPATDPEAQELTFSTVEFVLSRSATPDRQLARLVVPTPEILLY